MDRGVVTKEERVRFLFNEFCLWRERVITSNYQHSFCDKQSNRVMRELRELGYYTVYSSDPKTEGYYYGLTKIQAESVEVKDIILTDVELGYDLSEDPEGGWRK